VGTFRGNAQGFSSRNDFRPKRQEPYRFRLAVFGDSFTHAPYLGQNWPDRAEDLTADRGEPVQFLNFAQSYAGLANWWSILTKVVEVENYELDGVIFAVWETNLLRGFTVQAMPAPRSPYQPLLFGRCYSWDPQTFPTTVEEARRFLEEDKKQFLLPPAEFEQTLQGRWPAPVPRHFRPLILTTLYRIARARPTNPRPPSAETLGDFEPGRKKLVDDLRRYLESRRLPALVIHLPSRDGLLGENRESVVHLEKAKTFATALGATFLDGRQVFAGMTPAEIRRQFFPHDGHWNQMGSDRFAAWVVDRLVPLKAPRQAAPVAEAATLPLPPQKPAPPGKPAG
jgi:hypothetical protein